MGRFFNTVVPFTLTAHATPGLAASTSSSRCASQDACASERFVTCAVITLLATHAGLLGWGAYRHSPTLNEPAHLAAGIATGRFGRFDLYQQNPPLVRALAALPVLASDAVIVEEHFDGRAGIRSAGLNRRVGNLTRLSQLSIWSIPGSIPRFPIRRLNLRYALALQSTTALQG